MKFFALIFLLTFTLCRAQHITSGLQLDIDPEQESGADGSAKATLTDQSGNGRTLTAASTPNPTIEWAECNGKKIIKQTSSQWYYALAADYDVTDFTMIVVCRILTDASAYFCTNAAGTDFIGTDRTASGDYWNLHIDAGPSQNMFARGLRSSTAWGAYMIMQDGTKCRMYDAGEICPQLNVSDKPPVESTGTNATMSFRRIIGNGLNTSDCEVARLLLYNRALSYAEVKQEGDYIYSTYAVSPKTAFFAEGNSYVPDTAGAGALTKSILADHKDDIDVFNVSTAGDSIAGTQSEYATEIQPYYASRRPFNIVGNYSFTNDLNSSGNYTTMLPNYWTYGATVQADGFKFIAVAPTAWHAVSNPSGVEANYQAMWPVMRSQAAANSDGFADPSVLTMFDDDDDTADTTYYNADRLHLNDTGSALVAALVEDEVEALMAVSPSTGAATTLNATTVNVGGP